MKKALVQDLTVGSVPKTMIRFAIPFMVSNLAQAMYNIVDIMIVGRFLGSASLAAVSVSGQIMSLIVQMGLGITIGAQILSAQHVGAGNRRTISDMLKVQLFLAAALALLVMAFVLAFNENIIVWLNTPAESTAEARLYLSVCSVGFLPLYAYDALAAILRGVGNSSKPMVFVILSAILNIVLDVLFVGGWHMGVAGAAWATVISQYVVFFAAGIFVLGQKKELGLRRHEAVDGSLVSLGLKLLKLGGPLSAQFVLVQLSMLFVNSFVFSYGVVATSVTGIGAKLVSLLTIVNGAMSTAVASMVGQNAGAGNIRRIKQIVYTGLTIGLTFWVLCSVFAWFFPREIYSFFTSDEAVLDLSVLYMHISILTYLGFTTMGTPTGLINGVGNTSLNLGIAVLDGVICRVGFSLILGIALQLGLTGFFLGNALAGWVTPILGYIYFAFGKWEDRVLT